MNPPLRSKSDQEALIEGLLDGTIDIIATDHAPHTWEEKQRGMNVAPFGIVGLETAFPLLYTHFVCRGTMELSFLLDKLTTNPSKIFQLPYGSLKEGENADIAVIDMGEERKIDSDAFQSKGRNTPFAGWIVKGWPTLTMMDGRITWKEAAMPVN
jgi:dihydroorotase